MDYHPGGWEELVRGAGIDATELFNEVHRWVNYESMLTACLVGKVLTEPLTFIRPSTTKDKKNWSSSDMQFALNKNPIIPPIHGTAPEETSAKTLQSSSISHDWYQTDSSIVITIYTKRRCPSYFLTSDNLIIDVTDRASDDEKKGTHIFKRFLYSSLT